MKNLIILLLISINCYSQDTSKKIPCLIIGEGAGKTITNQEGVVILRDGIVDRVYKDFEIDVDLYKHWFLNSKEGRVMASWLEFHINKEKVGKDIISPKLRAIQVRNYILNYVVPAMQKEIEKYGGY